MRTKNTLFASEFVAQQLDTAPSVWSIASNDRVGNRSHLGNRSVGGGALVADLLFSHSQYSPPLNTARGSFGCLFVHTRGRHFVYSKVFFIGETINGVVCV